MGHYGSLTAQDQEHEVKRWQRKRTLKPMMMKLSEVDKPNWRHLMLMVSLCYCHRCHRCSRRCPHCYLQTRRRLRRRRVSGSLHPNSHPALG